MGTLTHQEAKRFYDSFGARQDSQGFYENPAVQDMIAHAGFGEAKSVCEFGCGTGRVAALLLSEQLPADATYLGLDISETMVALAERRLEHWADRARIVRVEGPPAIPAADHGFDRVFSTYVTDLLDDADLARLLNEAHRVLRPGGLFCNAGLTDGQGPLSRLVMGLWQRVNAWRPQLLGGCRPMRIRDHLDPVRWDLAYHATLCRFGICSEVTVARARPLDVERGE